MLKVSQKLLTLLFCTLLTATVSADALMRDNHPERYVVQKGDTLWDISGKFLNKPWRWPEIWHVNPQIANPHLIYPGDQLELVYIDGQPRLQMNRGHRTVKLSPGSTVKLSPTARSRPWDGAIPTVPVSAIAPFLTRPYVMDQVALDSAPYIVHFGEDHVIGGAGNKAYVRSIEQKTGTKYDVIRPGDAYKDYETQEVLGYEAAYIGTSELVLSGDPATIFLNNTQQEAVIGDRLTEVPTDRALVAFVPQAPPHPIHGAIISVLNGVSQIGQYNVVVIDRGANDGLKQGTVLRIDKRGAEVRDVVTPDSRDTVTLPDEQAGTLMVFRAFERVSFGLVMDATQAIHVGDRVLNP